MRAVPAPLPSSIDEGRGLARLDAPHHVGRRDLPNQNQDLRSGQWLGEHPRRPTLIEEDRRVRREHQRMAGIPG